jgi:hypothetical protein
MLSLVAGTPDASEPSRNVIAITANEAELE